MFKKHWNLIKMLQHEKIFSIVNLCLIVVSASMCIGLTYLTNSQGRLEEGSVYNTCNKSSIGETCRNIDCWTKACNILKNCPEVIITNENPWVVPTSITTENMLLVVNNACLILSFILSFTLFYEKIRK